MKHSRASIEKKFRSIVSSQLGLDISGAPGSTTLLALGLDLVGLLDLTTTVEIHFDVRTSGRRFSGAFTLDESLTWLETMIAEGGRDISEPVMAEGAD